MLTTTQVKWRNVSEFNRELLEDIMLLLRVEPSTIFN